MADFRQKIMFSVLMNELLSSVDTEELFSSMTRYVTAERDAEDTGVLAASAVVTKMEHDVLTSVQSYYETTVHLYSVNSFKSHFRMHRSTVQVTCEKLGGGGYVSGCQVPIEKKVLMTICIWTMANQEPYRTIGDRFAVNRGTAHRCVMEVLRAVRRHLYDEYIVWPATLEMCSRNAQIFESKYGFSGCVGCVDGSHIPVKPPANDRDSYINRKGYASVNLLAVCDHKMSFIATYAERAGSVHDARVFRVCDTGQKAARNELFPSTEFHLLGDSAYALMQQVMVPYRDNGHLTDGQKKYNVRHSATRSVIERAFGRLRGKFRRLKGLDVTRTDFAPTFIESACVLHNLVLQHEENDDDDDHIDNAADVCEEWCEDESTDMTTDSQAQCSSAERNRAKHKRDEIMINLS